MSKIIIVNHRTAEKKVEVENVKEFWKIARCEKI